MGSYTERFGASCPNTRNMDTLVKQANGLRSRAANDPKYVEFVAQNMERIAEEYANIYSKMVAARSALGAIQDITVVVYGEPIKEGDE